MAKANTSRHVPALRTRSGGDESLRGQLSSIVLDLVGQVPASDEPESRSPQRRARTIASAAAGKAALAAGTLALPPGPLGWLTILPELAAIWRIQRQMVADIASVHGASASLTRSHMLHCLFRHAAAQALRDVGVQVGARLLIQDVPLRTIERIAARIGIDASQRLVGRGLTRWLPVVGAVGVGAYAWYDTNQVARTAMALFRTAGDGGTSADTADHLVDASTP